MAWSRCVFGATPVVREGIQPQSQTALRVRDPGLVNIKNDPLLDPLRKEPRFQTIERALKFPT